MSSNPNLKGPGLHRVAPAQQWRDFVRSEVKRLIETCESAGMTHYDIAERVGCHRTAISLWKNGKADIYAGSYEALRSLASKHGKRKATGT